VPGGRPGSLQGQYAGTTVSARLGEWVEIAGVESGLNTNTTAATQSRRVWLKVEEAR
jgi:hypothetical protein